MKAVDAMMGQFEVVHALALRETRTRFGAHKLGFFWALVEPSIFILTFFVLFKLGGRDAPVGMTLFSFMATGVIPYLIFANTVNRVAESINGNKSLLFYPQVNPLDVVFARAFLEFTTYAGVFMILMGIESLYLQQLTISDPLLVLMSFVLASLLGTGLGLVFCGLAQFSNAVDRARGPIMRPFFWVSGIFFTAAGLPPEARQHMLHNPVLHLTELSRAGWFDRYEQTHADPLLVLTWSVGLLLLGLTLERVVRRKIEVT